MKKVQKGKSICASKKLKQRFEPPLCVLCIFSRITWHSMSICSILPRKLGL